MTSTDVPQGRPGSPRLVAAGALVVAIILSAWFTGITRTVPIEPHLMGALSYLVFWAPFLVAVALSAKRGAWRIRFTPIDLLWGLGLGLLSRAMATLIEMGVYGHPGVIYLEPLSASPLDLVFFAVVTLGAPLLLSPIIEELFFRGVVLDAIRGASRSAAATVIAVGGSAVIFSLFHTITAQSVPTMVAAGLSTLLFGVLAGALAATTGRLGGAIVAHVVFNGALLATLLG